MGSLGDMARRPKIDFSFVNIRFLFTLLNYESLGFRRRRLALASCTRITRLRQPRALCLRVGAVAPVILRYFYDLRITITFVFSVLEFFLSFGTSAG